MYCVLPSLAAILPAVFLPRYRLHEIVYRTDKTSAENARIMGLSYGFQCRKLTGGTPMRRFVPIALLLIVLLLTGCAAGGNDAIIGALSTSASTKAVTTSGTTQTFAATTVSTTTVSTTAASTTAAPESTYSPSDGIDADGFYSGVRALDYVTLPDLDALTIPADVHTPTDDAIQEKISAILANYASAEQITDRAVEDGDTVCIDFVGSIDGVEFEGGNTRGQGTIVTIGVTNYIDDFLQQLIGHKPGETVNVEVTFPEDYGKENLNGKDAVFVTEIHYIAGEEILPTFDDAFVAENLSASYGWNTADDVRTAISESLRTSGIRKYIETYLMENTTVRELPAEVLDYQKSALINYYKTYAAYYSVTFEEFISGAAGVDNVQELLAKHEEDITRNATLELIKQAVAEQNDFTCDDAALAAYFLEKSGTEDYSSYLSTYGEGYLRNLVLFENTMAYLTENAKLA
jgi:trigger factor